MAKSETATHKHLQQWVNGESVSSRAVARRMARALCDASPLLKTRRGGRPHVFCIEVGHDEFHDELQGQVREQLEHAGIEVSKFSPPGLYRWDDNRELRRRVDARIDEFDGGIVDVPFLSDPEKAEETRSWVGKLDVPMVLVDQSAPAALPFSDKSVFVSTGDKPGGVLAGRKVAELGRVEEFRRILVASGNKEGRLHGFRAVLGRHLPDCEVVPVTCPDIGGRAMAADLTYKIFREAWLENRLFDAVVGLADWKLRGAMDGFARLESWGCPRPYFFAYDCLASTRDLIECGQVIGSVVQDIPKLALATAEALLDHFAAEEPPARELFVRPLLYRPNTGLWRPGMGRGSDPLSYYREELDLLAKVTGGMNATKGNAGMLASNMARVNWLLDALQ